MCAGAEGESLRVWAVQTIGVGLRRNKLQRLRSAEGVQGFTWTLRVVGLKPRACLRPGTYKVHSFSCLDSLVLCGGSLWLCAKAATGSMTVRSIYNCRENGSLLALPSRRTCWIKAQARTGPKNRHQLTILHASGGKCLQISCPSHRCQCRVEQVYQARLVPADCFVSLQACGRGQIRVVTGATLFCWSSMAFSGIFEP